MESISDSVHQLLEDQIRTLGLEQFYEIQKSIIIGPTFGLQRTEFTFWGLRHNPTAIKSLEGADILWVEEAANVSKHSWDVVIPTMRKDNSEIWVSFNPELETDDTYQRFVVHPPPNSQVVKLDWRDNPWFPKVLADEREHLLEVDPDAEHNIYGGFPRSSMSGAIFENEMRSADKAGRITSVPYDPSRPVHTAWDIGWGDNTVIWMFQSFPFEWRFIDYEAGNQKDLSAWLGILQKRNYTWGTDYLPWDAGSMVFRVAIQETMRRFGRNAVILNRQERAIGIEKARQKLATSWFDSYKCADGLQALRHYRYGEIERLGTTSREPLHDWASHPADAYRTFAVGVDLPKPNSLAPDPNKRTPPPKRHGAYTPFG